LSQCVGPCDRRSAIRLNPEAGSGRHREYTRHLYPSTDVSAMQCSFVCYDGANPYYALLSPPRPPAFCIAFSAVRCASRMGRGPAGSSGWNRALQGADRCSQRTSKAPCWRKAAMIRDTVGSLTL